MRWVFVCLASCPGDAGSDAGVLPAATYTGTNTSTCDVVGFSRPSRAAATISTTTPVTVHVAPPLHEEGDGTESNPFHFDLGPQTDLMQAGVLFLTTAFEQPNPNAPPLYDVITDWTFTYDPATGQVDGSLTRPLTHDPNNMVYTKETGGPVPGLDVCIGTMITGATVRGTITRERVDLTIAGEAGGYTVGPTCLEQFHFSSHIVATRP
ncbi:MAG: hypothetical protein ACXWLM_00850 [Myxococcales bacterium]